MNQKKKRKYLRYILVNFAFAAVIVTILMNFIFSAIKINGHSMSPVLKDGERVIISRFYLRNNIERFDIVVLANPLQKKKSLVKRVIALPDETIQWKDGRLYVNDKPLLQPFLKTGNSPFTRLENSKPITVEKDHYFVMGDNRDFSKDSRAFGTVPARLIYGKAIFRYWPLSKFGSIR